MAGKPTYDELTRKVGELEKKIVVLEQGTTSEAGASFTGITERRQSDLAVQESEERFRKAFQTSPDAININRLEDGIYVDINDGFTSLTGYTADDVIGKSSLEIDIWHDPQDRERLVAGLEKDGYVRNLEAGFRIKNDGIITGLMSARIIMLDNAPHILSITRDIEELKESEEALKKAVATTEAIVAAMGQGLSIQDTGFTILFQNRIHREMVGDHVGETCYRAYHDKDRVCGDCPMAMSFKDGKIHTRERTASTGQGEKWFEITTSPLKNSTGEIIGGVEVLRDITERKQAEEDLKSITGQLSFLLESLPIVVMTRKATDDLAINYISGNIREITGFTPQQFTEDAAFWENHIHLDDRGMIVGGLPEILESGSHSCTYRFQTADGSYKWFSCISRFVPSADDGNSHIVSTLRDITEEKKLRQEAEERLQQVIQADKLASLGEVVAGVAHEINNPNSFIAYNAPLLEETWHIFEPLLAEYGSAHKEWRSDGLSIEELCQDTKEIIEAIKVGSDRINKVVTNLKDFARLDESTHTKAVQINEVIHKTLIIVGAQARKHVGKIEMHLADNLPVIYGHFQKLEQVVANLVVNAAYAIPEKETGRLTITTRFLERLDSVLIEIEDNGIGMAPEVVEKIFEPFYTTRRDSGGTGLGLSVSYGLIKEHKGNIGVLSRPGLGSRFTLFLPVDRRKAGLELRPTILCVDDDVTVLVMLNSYFVKTANLAIETLSNPESVVEYLEEHPEVDIVLADVMMPGIDGWELLAKIKQRFPLLPVILMSGSTEALAREPDGFKPDYKLLKPFKMNNLMTTVNAVGRQRL